MPRERGQNHQIQTERTLSITVDTATFSDILMNDMLLLAGTKLMLPFFLYEKLSNYTGSRLALVNWMQMYYTMN